MRVLAIDTALAACSAAVLDTARWRHSSPARARHDARPCRSADAAHRAGHGQASGMAFRDLDRVVVTTGPAVSPACGSASPPPAASALRPTFRSSAYRHSPPMPRPISAPTRTSPVVAAIDARHGHVYLQVFAPGGRTLIATRLAPLSEAVRAASEASRPASSVRPPKRSPTRWPKLHRGRSTVDARGAPDIAWIAQIGAVLPEEQWRRRNRNICARPTPSRRTPPNCHADDGIRRAPVSRGAPASGEARPTDAAAIAAVHGVHSSAAGARTRLPAPDREQCRRPSRRARPQIDRLYRLAPRRRRSGDLSVAVAPAWRGRKLSRSLLDLHLRRLAGLGARAVFLEVGKNNTPARALYRRAGFPKSASARAIIRRRRRRWCCAAISADAARELNKLK